MPRRGGVRVDYFEDAGAEDSHSPTADIPVSPVEFLGCSLVRVV